MSCLRGSRWSRRREELNQRHQRKLWFRRAISVGWIPLKLRQESSRRMARANTGLHNALKVNTTGSLPSAESSWKWPWGWVAPVMGPQALRLQISGASAKKLVLFSQRLNNTKKLSEACAIPSNKSTNKAAEPSSRPRATSNSNSKSQATSRHWQQSRRISSSGWRQTSRKRTKWFSIMRGWLRRMNKILRISCCRSGIRVRIKSWCATLMTCRSNSLKLRSNCWRDSSRWRRAKMNRARSKSTSWNASRGRGTSWGRRNWGSRAWWTRWTSRSTMPTPDSKSCRMNAPPSGRA